MIYWWFKAIVTPSCWIQNYSYSKKWDAKLNELMKSEKFEVINPYVAKIGNYEIWIGNHPYASFTTRNRLKVRPSMATILKAREKLEQDVLDD